jgi:hypothetical protein
MKRTRPRAAFGLVACALALLAPGALAQQESQGDPPSLTTYDVLNIPDAASYEFATKRAEARARAALAAESSKAAKGYLRMVSPSGFAFERPESWQAIDIQASGAPGGFKSEAVYQDTSTGAVLTAMSFDRTAAGEALDIANKETVDRVLNLMLNPSNDAATSVKVIKRETGEEPERGTQWVRVKAEGVSQAEGGGSVPATFWVQMAQSKGLVAVVAVAFPSEQRAAAVPAFHSVRTLEVVSAGAEDASREASGGSAPATAPNGDGAGSRRQP